LSTKLSRYTEGIMEAAWLTAAIVVPVFFDIYSSRIFEPDKITLLRTLALVILGAWLIKLIEQGGAQWQRLERGKNWFQSLRNIPLLLPAAALVVVYLIATIFSVSPAVSLWGSYQRLQGTYTTFSYLVIFIAMAANLRRRAQVQRLITVVIFSSLPVCLYGLLQHFQLDPIPWGGDTTQRIAANMGNSIFVAAYLIMVFPLTLMRIVESFEALVAAPVASREKGSRQAWQFPDFIRATSYVFIIALQAIALYFSNSRGPWLGWAASLVFLWLGLSLIWRKRWLTFSGVVLALVAGSFLVVLNIPNGPLESLRTRPEFGRLGQLIDVESRTGKVRALIWQGASELVLPHAPLEFPDGSQDTWNFLRPLIGYGPESMYVAYNPFYPPELTLVEKRNASPDRSHNETWDSLVITGLLGLVVYLVLFGSVLYFGLKWIGLVQSDRQRNLYLGLYIGGGLVSTIIFLLWRGLSFLGVALPFGMLLGVVAYLILVSVFGKFAPVKTAQEKIRAYILLGLLAAVVAHFVEINFGIAIASTRTYFWTYSGLLLLVGFILPRYGEFQDASHPETGESLAEEAEKNRSGAVKGGENLPAASGSKGSRAKKSSARYGHSSSTSARRKPRSTPESETPFRFLAQPWQQEALILGLILSIVMVTLGYLYITNASRLPSAAQTIWKSLTLLKSGDANSGSSGLLTLVLTTWLVGAVLLVSETLASGGSGPAAALVTGESSPTGSGGDLKTWVKMVGITLGTSFIVMLIFWFWHAGGLVSLTRNPANSMDMVLAQVQKSEGILTHYYIYLFLIIFGLAFFLQQKWPGRLARFDGASWLFSAGVALVLIFLVTFTNLRIIQADIAFKTGDLFAQPDTWPVSIAIYDRARDLAPSEDYYYLFLGRAYLEYAKTISDVTQRDQLIQQAAQDLKRAQQINPLNTDHTANLARLYNLWAAASTDATQRAERAKISEQYFTRALVLSPNSARLWDEFALLYLNVLNQPQDGADKLNRALEIDPYYDWTYALLGDYTVRYVVSDPALTAEQRQQTLQTAAGYYQKALDLSAASDQRYNYLLAAASVQSELGQASQAIDFYLQAIQIAPKPADNWRIQEVVARLYSQQGDQATALQYALSALAGAPDDQKERIQALVTELGG
jgi:tetratricopeptide (TPR) repeat protein/O-antigen ligase